MDFAQKVIAHNECRKGSEALEKKVEALLSKKVLERKKMAIEKLTHTTRV